MFLNLLTSLYQIILDLDIYEICTFVFYFCDFNFFIQYLLFEHIFISAQTIKISCCDLVTSLFLASRKPSQTIQISLQTVQISLGASQTIQISLGGAVRVLELRS